MPVKMPKYKISALFVIIMIIFVLAGCIYMNNWYLVEPEIKEKTNVSLQIEEGDMELITQIKNHLINSPEYNNLVPVDLPIDFQDNPTAKIYPFIVNSDE